ncbi:phosphatase PAP2 family protein [Solitalea koreensis]|uniref:Undecaprenyl-diphosphatase n=1 Tax=Solitalea koreensis TaxID=543615 RepID=A0A521D7K0_9SPHI|nr:phosphatase PAP2 family protein [Solitalea koreensis]SMO67673.1 undecaprenyl-diphosphatase [Solitalea koreensis]
MIDQLLNLDRKLFIFINSGLSNSMFDLIMPWFRNPLFWAPLYLFMIIFFIKEYKIKGLYLIGFLLLTFAIADFTSASIIKPVFQRLRPCNDVSMAGQINLLVNCGKGFSFVSSHATNHFAISLFLIGTFGKRWPWVIAASLIWAAVVSFAQVYVGLHYPIDVLCGGLLGALIGVLISSLQKTVFTLDGDY